MGEAKRRGTKEVRVLQAIERNAEMEVKRLADAKLLSVERERERLERIKQNPDAERKRVAMQNRSHLTAALLAGLALAPSMMIQIRTAEQIVKSRRNCKQ